MKADSAYPLKPRTPDQPSAPNRRIGRFFLLTYAALFVIGMGYCGVTGFASCWLCPSLGGWTLAESIVFSMLVAVVVVLSSWAMSHKFAFARTLETHFQEILGPMSRSMIVAVALASAIAEELIFRGCLLPSLGLVASSVIFGMLHVGPSRIYLPWTAMALGMGFVFGWMFMASGNLLAPIICHALINGLQLSRLCRP